VNTSHDPQAQGYTNDMSVPVAGPYTHSPVGPEGGSGSIREHSVFLLNSMLNSSFLGQTPSNAREAHMMGQQAPPALQHSYSSRLGGSASGRERGASYQPSQIRPGNAVSPHNVQEQHHYVHRTPGKYRYLPCRRVPALILNISSSTACYRHTGILGLFSLLQQ